MQTSIPAYLREGMASGDLASRRFWNLWLQASVVATATVFAVIFTVLADHVMAPIEGLHPRVLLIDTAIFLPAVFLGLVCAMWPLRVVMMRIRLGALATAVIAPAAGTAMLCLAATGFMMLCTGSLLDELVSHPGLTLLAMLFAGLPAMLLAQEMIWPWRDRAGAAITPSALAAC